MFKSFTIACTGYEIAADLYEGLAEKVIVVLPGYTSTKAKHVKLARALQKGTGATILVIDYSGHGVSPFELKDTRPAQHFLEVICMFDWIKRSYPNAQIAITGSSYGGFLATQLTKYREFEQLVLRAPAIIKPNAFYDTWARRLQDEEAYMVEMRPYRSNRELLSKHPLLARASSYAGKTLVMVHEHDSLVPVETTDAYAAAFSAEVYFAKDLPHSLSGVNDAKLIEYEQYLINWLNNSLL